LLARVLVRPVHQVRDRLTRWLADTPLGAKGERLARRYLKRHGYRPLATNLRNRFGEIDLLVEAPDRRTLVLVEVKAGAGSALPPEVHVTRDKRRRLTALAAQLLRRYRLTHRPLRFDVVIVHWSKGEKPDIRHYPGAFESHV
jgi:putative endonuclease